MFGCWYLRQSLKGNNSNTGRVQRRDHILMGKPVDHSLAVGVSGGAIRRHTWAFFTEAFLAEVSSLPESFTTVVTYNAFSAINFFRIVAASNEKRPSLAAATKAWPDYFWRLRRNELLLRPINSRKFKAPEIVTQLRPSDEFAWLHDPIKLEPSVILRGSALELRVAADMFVKPLFN